MIFFIVMKNKIFPVEVLLISFSSCPKKSVFYLSVAQVHYHIHDYLIYAPQFSFELFCSILLVPSLTYEGHDFILQEKIFFKILEVPLRNSVVLPGRVGVRGIHFMLLILCFLSWPPEWNPRGNRTLIVFILCFLHFFSSTDFMLYFCFCFTYVFYLPLIIAMIGNLVLWSDFWWSL